MAEPHRRTALVAHPGVGLYGTDRVTLQTVAALVDRGWGVVLALPGRGPLASAARELGADVVHLAAPPVIPGAPRLWRLPGFLARSVPASARIDALLTDLRPAVVYVSSLSIPLWIARARARRIPVLCHVHESLPATRPVRAELAALPLLLADRVIADSRFALDRLTDSVPALAARSGFLPSGVAAPTSVTPPRGELTGALRLACVGRLAPGKGVDVALEALAVLLDSGIDTHLDLVGTAAPGDEWYERDLHTLSARLEIQEHVTFHGVRSDPWRALAEADVAVVPSRREESFGGAVVEAVLAARPVAVSAIGGLPEAIDGVASGISVEPDDPVALAHAVHRIASEWPSFRRSALAAVPVAARRYEPARYAAAIAGELERVAAPAWASRPRIPTPQESPS